MNYFMNIAKFEVGFLGLLLILVDTCWEFVLEINLFR